MFVFFCRDKVSFPLQQICALPALHIGVAFSTVLVCPYMLLSILHLALVQSRLPCSEVARESAEAQQADTLGVCELGGPPRVRSQESEPVLLPFGFQLNMVRCNMGPFIH